MQETEVSLGILSLSGVTTPEYEIEFLDFRVRKPMKSVVRMIKAWTSVFDEAVPRVART